MCPSVLSLIMAIDFILPLNLWNSEESEVFIAQKNSIVMLWLCISYLVRLVDNAWSLYELNIRGCHPPSAQCTKTKWSHSNYSFHAWEGSFSEVSWCAPRKEKENQRPDWQERRRERKRLPASAEKQAFIVLCLVLLLLSHLLTAAGASVAQITTICYNVNFSPVPF